jgi:hypothetical protein
MVHLLLTSWVPPLSPLSCFLDFAFPAVVPKSRDPDQVFNDAVSIPRLHVTTPLRPSARTAATSPADSDDEVPILHFSLCAALISCCGVAVIPLPRPSVSRRVSSLLLHLPSYCSLNLPRESVDDALSGMVNADVPLLLLLHGKLPLLT